MGIQTISHTEQKLKLMEFVMNCDIGKKGYEKHVIRTVINVTNLSFKLCWITFKFSCNFYVEEMNGHSPSSVQQIPITSLYFECIEPRW